MHCANVHVPGRLWTAGRSSGPLETFLRGGLWNPPVQSPPNPDPHYRVSHIPHTSTHHKTDTFCTWLQWNLARSLRNMIPKCVEAAHRRSSSVYIASNYMFSKSHIELSSIGRRLCADPTEESVCAVEQQGGISVRGRSGRGRAPQPAHNQLGGQVDYTAAQRVGITRMCVCVCLSSPR